MINLDEKEIAKFEALAHRWWDKESEFKPLHEINALRINWIDAHAPLHGKKVLDIGCGGGIASEAMAYRGAEVTGIDMGETPLKVAQHHAQENGLTIHYQRITAEQLAEEQAGQYDIITCLEMLEHVPDPSLVVAACAKLLKPGGQVFFSTLNRNPKSYLFAIVGAEYLLKLLPKGTHEYAKFIKPSELHQYMRHADLNALDITGMVYNPITKIYRLNSKDVDVNYLVYAQKPLAS